MLITRNKKKIYIYIQIAEKLCVFLNNYFKNEDTCMHTKRNKI